MSCGDGAETVRRNACIQDWFLRRLRTFTGFEKGQWSLSGALGFGFGFGYGCAFGFGFGLRLALDWARALFCIALID